MEWFLTRQKWAFVLCECAYIQYSFLLASTISDAWKLYTGMNMVSESFRTKSRGASFSWSLESFVHWYNGIILCSQNEQHWVASIYLTVNAGSNGSTPTNAYIVDTHIFHCDQINDHFRFVLLFANHSAVLCASVNKPIFVYTWHWRCPSFLSLLQIFLYIRVEETCKSSQKKNKKNLTLKISMVPNI